jgi:hypothetical protein
MPAVRPYGMAYVQFDHVGYTRIMRTLGLRPQDTDSMRATTLHWTSQMEHTYGL